MFKRNAEILFFLLNLHLAVAPPPPSPEESRNEYPRLSVFSTVNSIKNGLKNFVNASYKLLEVKSLVGDISNWFGQGNEGENPESNSFIYTSDGSIFVETNDNERKRKEDEIIAAEFAPNCDIPPYPDFLVTPPPDTVNEHGNSDFYFEESEKLPPNDGKNDNLQLGMEKPQDNDKGNADNSATDNFGIKNQDDFEVVNVEEFEDNELGHILINLEEKIPQDNQATGQVHMSETTAEQTNVKKSTNESDPDGKESDYSTNNNTPEFISDSKTTMINENAQNPHNNEVTQKNSNPDDLKEVVQEDDHKSKSDFENQGKEFEEIAIESTRKENLLKEDVKVLKNQKIEPEMYFINGKTSRDTKTYGSEAEIYDSKYPDLKPSDQNFDKKGTENFDDINQPEGQIHDSVHHSDQKNIEENTKQHERDTEENDYASKIELTKKFISEERKALAREKMADLVNKSDKEVKVDQNVYLSNQSNKITDKESSVSGTNKTDNNESQESIHVSDNLLNDIIDDHEQTHELSQDTEKIEELNLLNELIAQENSEIINHKIIKKNLKNKNNKHESNSIKSDIKLVQEKMRKTENEINVKEKQVVEFLKDLNIEPETIKKYLKKFRKENALMNNKNGEDKPIRMIDIFEKISNMMEEKDKKKKKNISIIREEDL